MKASVGTFVGLMIVASLSALAWAKGATKLIVIEGPRLTAALEIADPEVTGTFNVWNGPGVQVNGQTVHLNPDNLARSFIDWARERVPVPAEGLDRYEAALIVDGRTAPGDRYVVTYAFDPSAAGGYIYLPRSSANTALIWHGVEGNWFHASAAWERLVRPLIENARIEADRDRRGVETVSVSARPRRS